MCYFRTHIIPLVTIVTDHKTQFFTHFSKNFFFFNYYWLFQRVTYDTSFRYFHAWEKFGIKRVNIDFLTVWFCSIKADDNYLKLNCQFVYCYSLFTCSICILLFSVSCCCHSVALWSFWHQNKFLVCVNITGNKALSDSDSDSFRFWFILILNMIHSDSDYFWFWFILIHSDSDSFWFWFILILIHSDSDYLILNMIHSDSD